MFWYLDFVRGNYTLPSGTETTIVDINTMDQLSKGSESA